MGYHPEEHKALAIVKEWGFVDVFREHIKKEAITPSGIIVLKMELHEVLAGEWIIYGQLSIAGKSIRSWIDREPRLWEKPSDHTPILAEISL